MRRLIYAAKQKPRGFPMQTRISAVLSSLDTIGRMHKKIVATA